MNNNDKTQNMMNNDSNKPPSSKKIIFTKHRVKNAISGHPPKSGHAHSTLQSPEVTSAYSVTPKRSQFDQHKTQNTCWSCIAPSCNTTLT